MIAYHFHGGFVCVLLLLFGRFTSHTVNVYSEPEIIVLPESEKHFSCWPLSAGRVTGNNFTIAVFKCYAKLPLSFRLCSSTPSLVFGIPLLLSWGSCLSITADYITTHSITLSASLTILYFSESFHESRPGLVFCFCEPRTNRNLFHFHPFFKIKNVIGFMTPRETAHYDHFIADTNWQTAITHETTIIDKPLTTIV